MAKKRKRTRSANLGEVSKKDFEGIAKILCRNNVSEGLRQDLAGYFGSQNPRFQAERFLAATRKC